MKIIEWNSQGAFRKKHENILSLNPDILVISECESEEKLFFGKLTPQPNEFIWIGDSPNKGIGIFSYSDYKLELLPSYNPSFRYIIPIKVTKGENSFLLFAVWAMDNKEFPEVSYVGQIWLAINYYQKLLHLPIIMTGDFNSNKIWDDKKRVGNHTDMVKMLEKYEVHSVYHSQNNQKQGEEKLHTFFMYRKEEKPYHIDYFFTSNHFIKGSTNLKIENFADWKDLSDHVPLILETRIPKNNFEHEYDFSYLIEIQLNDLSTETKRRFNDVMEDIVKKAKSLNNLHSQDNIIQQRKILTNKIDRLNNINQLIDKL